MPASDTPPEPPSELSAPAPGSFDLASLIQPESKTNFSAIRPRCDLAAANPNEIVVCAPDPEEERTRPLPGEDLYHVESAIPEARWKLAEGVDLDVHMEAEVMPNGVTSNRVMTGLKIGF